MKRIITLIYLSLILSLPTLSLTGCMGAKLPVTAPDRPPPVIPLKSQPRVALVLGSGGARGYAHLGVIEALEEAGIKIDLLAGSSAGSIVAALYADNGSAKKTKDILLGAGLWDFTELSNMGSVGVIKGTSFEYFMLRHLQARQFSQLSKKLLVATTDLRKGNTYVVESGPIVPALLASSAIPGFVAPVKLYHHTLIDGGVADPVPVNLVKPFHPKVIIAVNLTQMTPRNLPTTAMAVAQEAFQIMYRRVTDDSLRGADIVITPLVDDWTFDTSHEQESYLAGLKAGRAAVPRIKKLLATRV